MKGKKRTLCQRRYRGSVKVRWLHLHSPCYSLTLLPKSSTLPFPGTKALISPHPFFMKSPFQLSFYALSSKLVTFPCLYRHKRRPWGSEDLYKEPWKRKSDHMPLNWRRWRKQESRSVFPFPVHVRNWIKAKKVTEIWGRVIEGGRIKSEDKFSRPRMRDPGEVQPGQPVTE